MKHVDKDFTKNDADLIFTKAKAKGKQRITLDQYKTALELCAKKKIPGKYRAIGRLVQGCP